MALTIEDVEYVASLARLGLTAGEKSRLRDQLSAILDNMNLLNELDVSEIPPTAQVIALTNVMRDDVVRPSLSQAEALGNAPRQSEGFFEVDSPLGGSEDAG
jgi:aspartyl-tRNA(Asn)/glutamyl-tRNA(Gln) amidotransferase subunit C